MNNFSKRIEKLNFLAKPLSKFLKEINSLADRIAIHTILLISFPESRDINHWKTELFGWLSKLNSANKVKTPSGKISESQLTNNLYSDHLGYLEFIKTSIHKALDEENLPRDTIKITKELLNNYQISLGAIYDDYIDYIMDEISGIELQDRMNKYYLYSD